MMPRAGWLCMPARHECNAWGGGILCVLPRVCRQLRSGIPQAQSCTMVASIIHLDDGSLAASQFAGDLEFTRSRGLYTSRQCPQAVCRAWASANPIPAVGSRYRHNTPTCDLLIAELCSGVALLAGRLQQQGVPAITLLQCSGAADAAACVAALQAAPFPQTAPPPLIVSQPGQLPVSLRCWCLLIEEAYIAVCA